MSMPEAIISCWAREGTCLGPVMDGKVDTVRAPGLCGLCELSLIEVGRAARHACLFGEGLVIAVSTNPHELIVRFSGGAIRVKNGVGQFEK